MRTLPKGFELVSLDKQSVLQMVEFEREQQFTDGWNENMLNGSFNQDNFMCLAVKSNQKIKGFITATISVDTADIEDIIVAKDCRRLGIASVLLEQTINIIRMLKKEKILLEVRESNISAIALYQGYGFKKIFVRKGYYQDSENAIVMAKELL